MDSGQEHNSKNRCKVKLHICGRTCNYHSKINIYLIRNGDSVRFKLLKSKLTVLLLQVINCFSNYGANWCYKPATIYWKNIVFQQCSVTFKLYKGMWCLLDLSSSNDGNDLDISWIYDPWNIKPKVRIHILHELSHVFAWMELSMASVRRQCLTRHF